MVGRAQIVDRLRELARNMWWTWQPTVINLFRDLDPVLWRTTDHNPVEFLKRISVEQLEKRAAEMALVPASTSRSEDSTTTSKMTIAGERSRLDAAAFAAGGVLLD